MNHTADEEAEAFLEQHGDKEFGSETGHETTRRSLRAWLHWRLFLELGLVAIIVFLLFFRQPPSQRLRRSPVPEFPRKITTFITDPKYTRDDMFTNESTTLHTLHNWIPLSSDSRGYIRAPANPRAYDLPTPHEIAIDRHNDGPGYMVSVFHQLHCLSYLAEHFSRGYAGIALEEKVGHHSAHCFNYIRQGVMCNADVTLEGKTDAGPGEGSEHECVDYDALLEWANRPDVVAWKWRNSLLPEDSVL